MSEITGKFFREAGSLFIVISGFDSDRPELSERLTSERTLEALREGCSKYSINELRKVYDDLEKWFSEQESEYDIPIQYRDFHARFGQVISDFISQHLLKDEDIEGEERKGGMTQ